MEPDINTFQNWKICDKYTPMTLADLLAWIQEHEDTYFLFDVKEVNYEECQNIINQIKAEVGENTGIYSRIVLSGKNTDMVRAYSDAGCFQWIHLWMPPQDIIEESINTPEKFIKFCKEQGVSSWSVEGKYLTEELAADMAGSGLKCYVYMVSSYEEISRYKSLGADFFISDVLAANSVEDSAKYDFYIKSAKRNGSKYFEIAWTGNEEDHYEVYRSSDGEDVLIGQLSGCTYRDEEKLEGGRLYGYYVRNKETGSLTPVYYTSVIDKPSKLSVKRLSETQVVVQWGKVMNANGYAVKRSIADGEYTVVKICFNGDETEFVDDYLEGASYRVQAYTTIGNRRYYSGYSKKIE